MKRFPVAPWTFFLAGISLVLVSCSNSASLQIAEDFSGEMTLQVHLNDVLESYYRDISGDYDSPNIFNTAYLNDQLNSREAIISHEIQVVDNQTIQVAMQFSDLNLLMRESGYGDGAEEVITRTRLSGGRQRLTIQLNPELVRTILSMSSADGNDLADFLLPVDGTDAETYREDLIWAFEDYAPESELNQMLDSAKLELRVMLPRSPGNIVGGRVLGVREIAAGPQSGASGVLFSIGMLELLTLDSTRSFSVDY